MLDFLRGPRPLNGIDEAVFKGPVPRKRISDAVIFCRIHSGKQLYTVDAVPGSRIGEPLQQKPACGGLSDPLCELQRRR